MNITKQIEKKIHQPNPRIIVGSETGRDFAEDLALLMIEYGYTLAFGCGDSLSFTNDDGDLGVTFEDGIDWIE